MQLRDYQNSAISNVRKSFQAKYRSVLLTLPTGAGKTVIFSEITRLAGLKGASVLILVHRKELIDQAGDKLTKADVKYGIIAAGRKESKSNVQVASVQTLINRLNNPNQFDLIIIDEAHHAVANSWRKIFDFYKSAVKLGVTATPMRMTGAGLGEIFDDLIVGSTIPELVEQKYLAEHEVYAPPNKLNLDKIRTIRGDYSKKEVEDELDKVDIVGDAVENYRRLGKNKPAIAFCISVKHGQRVTNKFKQAGYTAELITGSMNSDDRKTLIDNFKDGKVQILVSIDVVSEGFDVEGCYVAILLRPTQSEALYIQQVGRVLRPEPNKVAIVLDHVGNTKRHGFVDDIREFDLHQKAKTKRKGELAPSVETCEQCFAVYRPQPICPVCGYQAENRERFIKQEEGELEELKRKEQEETERKQQKLLIGAAKTLEELEMVAKILGYKKGWAYRVYESRKKMVDQKLSELGAIVVKEEKLTPYSYRYEIQYGKDLMWFSQAIESIENVEILSIGKSLELIKDPVSYTHLTLPTKA